MKKIWIIAGVAAAVAAVYFYRKKTTTTAPAPVKAAAVTAGSNQLTTFTNFLGGFGLQANAQQTNVINSAYSNLQAVSALFGAGSTGNGVPVGNVNTSTSASGPQSSVDTSGLDDAGNYGDGSGYN